MPSSDDSQSNGLPGDLRETATQLAPNPASQERVDETVIGTGTDREGRNVPGNPTIPQLIGRYHVERILGQGAFGVVYLAQDNQLQRLVAIKVPHRKLVERTADAEAYLSEARAVASLDHPHIIPVYDVGSTEDFPCFVVSKFIDGTELASQLKQSRLSQQETVALVATVAEALDHAHRQRLVHRDIKPGNLILDKTGKCFLADFGLALREQDVGTGPRYAGTPAYMSPEQARGEGHRVDGRSDIFSLGVVLYELLTGQRPFRGEGPAELLRQVISHDPRPLRQIDDAIPKELERICLKALAKRSAERFAAAQDMADDLRHFLAAGLAGSAADSLSGRSGDVALPQTNEPSSPGRSPSPAAPSHSALHLPTSAESQAAAALTLASGLRPLRIVPKGLRSFDSHDADFFLELLPGPRDRDGLPDSLRFWKTRIEGPDTQSEFPVGLIYGPSGCGKSSLMKAGLLPRLSDSVISVYVEATASETESRLLYGLRKRFPDMPDSRPLKDTLAALRHGRGLPGGKKILIVLDQFEQWLHAHKDDSNTELIQALRQCDGEHVQCIVMVRDDFWLAVSRFLRDLEIRIVEGQNSALVDLFDLDHAGKVLTAFGRAFGRLPEGRGEISREQREFVKLAVAGLAQDGKVISVRLALFAEMMRSRPWTPAALKEVGGAAGIGVTFLEETFSAGTARVEYRRHQQAARDVLKALLPELGTDIKGHMRSYDELLEASGYAVRHQDFDDLIHILDGEIRLITPTDPDWAGGDESIARMVPGKKYYQLTHDYLVHSLRDWLNRKQQETRRGRAELRLAEWTALWQDRPENRHLPSSWDYLTAVTLVPRGIRSEIQQKMLRQAGRFHAARWGSAAAVLLLIGVIIWNVVAGERRSSLRRETVTAVDAVQNNRGLAVPLTLHDLDRLPRELVVPELKARYLTAPPQHKTGLAYALAHYDDVDCAYLVSQIQRAAPDEVDNLITALGHARETALEILAASAKQAEADRNWPLTSRLAIVALHLGDIRLASDACRVDDRPDPGQRAIFVVELPAWHGDLVKLAKPALAISDPALRSAICLGIGGIPAERLLVDELEIWKPMLSDWFQSAPDGATHGAAGWALRRLEIETPAIPARNEPEPPRAWFVNSVGMTLLKVDAGEFIRRDQVLEPIDQKVRLTRPFFFAEREVNVGQFLEFINDPDCPEQEKAGQWPGINEIVTPTPDYPVRKVDWYDAVLFCNWLSRREGRTACYERTGTKEKIKDQEYDAWRRIPDATGYRLPTEAEWEYTCRAGATLDLNTPRDNDLVRKFALFQSPTAAPGGIRLPNAWGFFDMLGNAWEWCDDWNGKRPAVPEVTDPVELSGMYREARGGSWFTSGESCRCSGRGGFLPNDRPGFRDGELGFRVALGAP